MKRLISLTALICLSAGTAHAGPEAFAPGPLIPAHGRVAPVENAEPIPADVRLRVVFDVAEAGQADGVNRRFETVARFLNMHAAAGVPSARLEAALVVHGAAARELTRTEDNANAALVEALIANGVRIYLCGQTAAYYDIKAEDLLPGVRMALSALTANALLQQQGYTLNPF